jgi:alkylation response protein AidB-like acyl-CoA dehydrogenase
MGDLGFMKIMVDPKYGGSSMDAISYVLVMENCLSGASASVMVSVKQFVKFAISLETYASEAC